MPRCIRNELRLSAIFRSQYEKSTQFEISAVTSIPVDNSRQLYAFATTAGEILIQDNLSSDPIIRIATDDDIVDLAFNRSDDDDDRFKLAVAHSGGLLRVWSPFEGILEAEFETGSEIISVHPTRISVLLRTADCEVRRFDARSAKVTDTMSGFSKSQDIRYIFSDIRQSLVGLVDGFGQLFIYDEERPLAPLVSEKSYNEAFSVAVSEKIVALVCPMKIILFMLDLNSKAILEPIKAILGTGWEFACIMSPTKILGFSKTEIFELIAEDTLSRISRDLKVKKHNVISTTRLEIFQADGRIEEIVLFNDQNKVKIIQWALGRKFVADSRVTHQSLASDGSHIFLIQYISSDGLRAIPLGIPEASIELDIPVSGELTSLSGSALDRRILAGFSSGQICCWITGTSQVEFKLSNISMCPIIRIDRVGNNLWSSLDSMGCICVVDRDRKILKFQPNMLIPLLLKRYDYEVTIDALSDTVSCSVFHPRASEIVHQETWSVTKQHPVSRKERSSGLKPSTQIELLNKIRVRKHSYPLQNQILSIDVGISLGCSNKELLDSVFYTPQKNPHIQIGVSVESLVTGTCQGVFFSDIPKSGALNTLLGIQAPTHKAGFTGWRGALDLLLNFLQNENTKAENRLVAQLKREIILLHEKGDLGYISSIITKRDVDAWENILVWIALGVCPHMLEGYRQAVTEIEREETPLSAITAYYISLVESLLLKTNSRKARLFEISLLTDSFAFVRCFVRNKPLFHEVFSTLFNQVSASDPLTSGVVTKLLLAIGQRNMASFGKRLALIVKTTHMSETPLLLIQKMIQQYRIHSIRSLPILFESVVLPCLDPMDYKVRKTSVGPVTELFKTMNKLYPMTSFHQNKQKIAIGSTQGQILVYDVRAGTKWRVLEGHTGAISAVSFDSSGKYLSSYSATDNTVRVWHLTMTGGINSGASGSLLGGLLGSGGGKCVLVKQLGETTETEGDRIKHPFDLNFRVDGVKIRWTSDQDILLVRETGDGVQIRL